MTLSARIRYGTIALALALAIPMWAISAYSYLGYNDPRGPESMLLFTLALSLLLPLGICAIRCLLRRPWFARHPYGAGGVSAFVAGYMVFLAISFQQIGLSLIGGTFELSKMAAVFIAPFYIFLLTSPVSLPFCLVAGLGFGCFLRRSRWERV